MPLWINALGVGGMGMVYGYILFYALKRYLPPVAKTPLSVKELLLLLGAMSISGVIGSSFASLDGVNYVGPYGIGFFLGTAGNIGLSLVLWRSVGSYEEASEG